MATSSSPRYSGRDLLAESRQAGFCFRSRNQYSDGASGPIGQAIDVDDDAAMVARTPYVGPVEGADPDPVKQLRRDENEVELPLGSGKAVCVVAEGRHVAAFPREFVGPRVGLHPVGGLRAGEGQLQVLGPLEYPGVEPRPPGVAALTIAMKDVEVADEDHRERLAAQEWRQVGKQSVRRSVGPGRLRVPPGEGVLPDGVAGNRNERLAAAREDSDRRASPRPTHP